MLLSHASYTHHTASPALIDLGKPLESLMECPVFGSGRNCTRQYTQLQMSWTAYSASCEMSFSIDLCPPQSIWDLLPGYSSAPKASNLRGIKMVRSAPPQLVEGTVQRVRQERLFRHHSVRIFVLHWGRGSIGRHGGKCVSNMKVCRQH